LHDAAEKSSGPQTRGAPTTAGSRSRSFWTWALVLGGIAGVTALHHLTSPDAVTAHNVYRRLYYLPIVGAAFAWGLRGGLLAALAVTAAYTPHAFFLHHHLDPAPAAEKLAELFLFLGVGALAGGLVDRERGLRAREQARRVAQAVAEARAEHLAGLVHLASGLAHELRNPLGGLQGAVEIAADAVPPSDPRREMVRIALAETARLGRVLDEFQDFARPREPEPRSFDPEVALVHTMEVLASEAARRGVTLRLAAGEACRTHADLEQITQVVVNLVKNAIEASPPGGQVVLEARPDGERVRHLARDDGPGVPPELGDAIFDPYVTGREGGTGLGLATSAMLVRRNGGRLGHAGRPRGGAEFTFDLPRGAGGGS